MLRSSIQKPQVLSSEDPILSYGFINLINIFEKLTVTLYDWVSSGGAGCGDATFLDMPPTSTIQSDLCKPVSVDGVLEIQQVDILITQQWLQAMMWKLSISHATQPGYAPGAVLPFHLPVLVGKAVMGVIGAASQGAVDAHGIGMVPPLLPFPSQSLPSQLTHASGTKTLRPRQHNSRRNRLPNTQILRPPLRHSRRSPRPPLGNPTLPRLHPRLAVLPLPDVAASL